MTFFCFKGVGLYGEDAIFKNLSRDEVYYGRAEIGAMLNYIYHVAFDAKSKTIFSEKLSNYHILSIAAAICEPYFTYSFK